MPPDAGSYVYEGESVPWFNWSALLMALLFTSFHGELLEISTTFFQRIIAGPQLHSLIITVAILLVLAACRPLVWDARKLNSKEVTAIFVLSSVVLFQLLALVFAKLDYRFGTLQAAESGQLVASVIVIALAVFVWLSRDYQKSWLEVGFLWLVVCVAAVVVSVYAALLYFGKAEVGLGRLYPRGTGLLIGSLLVILSAAAIFATKIRHMSPAEMAFFWMFGSLGLTVFVRILSIALYGRAYEIQTLSGTISGFVVSLVLGLVLLTRQVRARRRSAT